MKQLVNQKRLERLASETEISKKSKIHRLTRELDISVFHTWEEPSKWWFSCDGHFLSSDEKGLSDNDALKWLENEVYKRSLFGHFSAAFGTISYNVGVYLSEEPNLTPEEATNLHDYIGKLVKGGILQDFFYEKALPRAVQDWLNENGKLAD